MTTHRLLKKLGATLLASAFALNAQAALTDISTDPLNTYSAPSSTDVKPNVLFVLDDSGSMDWDYMPDQVGSYSSTAYRYKNSAFNGVAYNPAITYKLPVHFNADGSLNTTSYPSMTGTSTATGADAAAKPNWNAVLRDGYKVQSTSTDTLTNAAYAYVVVPGEYCSSASLRTCVAATEKSVDYPFAANLRWCSDSALTNCRATYDSATYKYPRIPSPRTATVKVSGWSSTSVSSVKVNDLELLNATTTASSTSSVVAANIVSGINSCSNRISGNCTTVGYSASSSGSTVTIRAPGAITFSPVITKSGDMTLTATSFAAGSVPGENLRVTITAGVTSYAYPGSSTKAETRTDCAGTTCTYAEEMTNYANWWAYYHTRMQMMKSATSNAFATIDSATDMANSVSRFRVGYLSINNNTSNDFLNLDEFKTTQKSDWFAKLFAANPNSSTPLREALSTAGRLYAGNLNGTTLNGSTVTDPLQFSCQQNYTILSTDGYWNGSSGYKLNGTTAMDNQDGGLPPPYNDGGSGTLQSRTSSLQSQTSTLKTQTSQLQQRTSTLEQRRSNDSGSTWYEDWHAVSSCLPDPTSSTRTECRYTAWTGWSDTASCTTANQDTSGTWSVGTARQCQWTGWTALALATEACTAITQDTSSPYDGNLASNGLARNCVVSDTTTWANVSSGGTCTATTVPDASGHTTQCRYTGWSPWTTVSTCSALEQSASPNYTAVTATECQTLSTEGTSNTLADVAAYYYGKDLRSAAATSPDATGTCTGPVIAPATVANDLCANNVPPSGADVATTQHMTTFTLGLGAQGQMVYSPTYASDKSGDFYDVKAGTTPVPASGVCSWLSSGKCTWPTPSSDSINNIDDLWHAAVNGRGTYFSAKDPASLSTGLADTLAAIINKPRPGTAAAAASSNPNISTSDNYVFSSSYKSVEWFGELIRQQIDSAGVLSSQQWSAMRLLDCATTVWTATTSYAVGSVFRNGTTCYRVTTEYVSGTDFGSTDTSKTAVVNDASGSAVVAPTTRTLYTKGAGALIPFLWADLVSASLGSYFTTPALTYASATAGLSQFCSSGATCLSAAQQSNNTVATGGAAGEALVNFLRGDRSNETTFYRKRTHVLGDIISSEGRYVKVPAFNYTDTNYGAFKAAKAGRSGKVYVSANDGMVHAFDAESGEETWAYIPSFVLPNLYKLADMNYSSHHQYSVDNSPETGDICPNAPTSACTAAQWKTILVGGLNRGGKGYFALDITNPASPTLLWEFSDANLGYSYGNPRITKLADGTWVVIVASGYNNADGVGRLYVLNANTGALIRTISTGVGSAATPSGLARISAHSASADTNNTTDAVYGGDLLGNLWRFDINNTIAPSGYDAKLLVSFTDPSGNPQPITARPSTATINGKTVVFVGTGRYLGISDLTNAQVESYYAVKDDPDAVTLGDPRLSASLFVRQTLTSGTCPSGAPTSWCIPGQSVRTSTNNAVDWDLKNGWYVDFLTAGERSVTDSVLALGTLLFTTIAPNNSSANACGTENPDASASYLYALDYKTGAPVQGTAAVSGVSLGNVIATRPIVLKVNGSIRYLVRTSGSSAAAGGADGSDLGGSAGGVVPTAPVAGATRRVSWRELVSE
ncbi:MAG: Type fimbrial biosis protein PilY1 [Proteobacteria bacterium]|nr:Type fimbrial biosis protein PilY1 [Pseudomonadota bacterium]